MTKPIGDFYTAKGKPHLTIGCKPCYGAQIKRQRAARKAGVPATRAPGRPANPESLGFTERPFLRLTKVQKIERDLALAYAEAN